MTHRFISILFYIDKLGCEIIIYHEFSDFPALEIDFAFL